MTAIGVAATHLWASAGSAEISGSAEQTVADVPPPVLVVERGKSRLIIVGDVSSAAHQAKILQIAVSMVPRSELTDELRLRTPLPAGWALVTELALRAIGQTHFSTAYVDEKQIFIRGFTSNPEAWQRAAERLEMNMLPDMRFRHDVAEVNTGASLEEQCQRLFNLASGARRVVFKRASDQLNSSAFALLDELIQIAADCSLATISITGHTDDSGDEQTNLYLSTARAESVVAYMVARGIAAERLQSHGAGSSAPLVTGDNTRARELNRRIEFKIAFPD